MARESDGSQKGIGTRGDRKVENCIYYVDEDNVKFGNMGRVVFNGKHYRLVDQADFTNRYLGDAMDGYFELKAPAVLLDTDGKDTDTEAYVYWIFEEVEDQELDCYDYDDIDRVVEDEE